MPSLPVTVAETYRYVVGVDTHREDAGTTGARLR